MGWAMKQQVTRWALALAAILGTYAFLNGFLVYQRWAAFGELSNGMLTDMLVQSLMVIAVQAAAIFVLLALTAVISRFALRGRFRIVLGLLLLVLAVATLNWYAYHGEIEGGYALTYGFFGIFDGSALAMVAGGWMVRTRPPKPPRDLVSPEIIGSWDSSGGVLEFGADGVFTLAPVGGTTTAGLWEPLPGIRPRVVLKVDADTALGHGWQATVLDLELSPHGAALRGSAAAYHRREAEAVLERAVEYSGHIGVVEVLEG